MPSALLLVCGDPRVLPADPVLTVTLRSSSRVMRFDLVPRGQRLRPALPPPKSLPA
jgi:hypothetical protein